ncbi:proteoglycan 4-like [Clytia hemisphaerica]|uniref:C2H2-type domain-containing protein n=1 Tax=Clytia hemisphaerica TaxID=252671 RepID=A0A7M5XEF0_9CNID
MFLNQVALENHMKEIHSELGSQYKTVECAENDKRMVKKKTSDKEEANVDFQSLSTISDHNYSAHQPDHNNKTVARSPAIYTYNGNKLLNNRAKEINLAVKNRSRIFAQHQKTKILPKFKESHSDNINKTSISKGTEITVMDLDKTSIFDQNERIGPKVKKLHSINIEFHNKTLTVHLPNQKLPVPILLRKKPSSTQQNGLIPLPNHKTSNLQNKSSQKPQSLTPEPRSHQKQTPIATQRSQPLSQPEATEIGPSRENYPEKTLSTEPDSQEQQLRTSNQKNKTISQPTSDPLQTNPKETSSYQNKELSCLQKQPSTHNDKPLAKETQHSANPLQKHPQETSPHKSDELSCLQKRPSTHNDKPLAKETQHIANPLQKHPQETSPHKSDELSCLQKRPSTHNDKTLAKETQHIANPLQKHPQETSPHKSDELSCLQKRPSTHNDKPLAKETQHIANPLQKHPEETSPHKNDELSCLQKQPSTHNDKPLAKETQHTANPLQKHPQETSPHKNDELSCLQKQPLTHNNKPLPEETQHTTDPLQTNPEKAPPNKNDELLVLKKRIISPEKQEIINCEECGETFTKMNLYYQHIDKHFKKDCQVRRKRFSSDMNIQPIPTKKRRDLKYKCAKCDKIFFWEASIKAHYRTQHSLPARKKKMFQCNHCERKFTSEKGLKIHRHLKHNKAKKQQRLQNKVLETGSQQKQVNLEEKQVQGKTLETSLHLPTEEQLQSKTKISPIERLQYQVKTLETSFQQEQANLTEETSQESQGKTIDTCFQQEQANPTEETPQESQGKTINTCSQLEQVNPTEDNSQHYQGETLETSFQQTKPKTIDEMRQLYQSKPHGSFFRQLQPWRSHIYVHPLKKFKCDECGEAYSKKLELDSHIIKKHTKKTKSRTRCEICKKDFDTVPQLSIHKQKDPDHIEKARKEALDIVRMFNLSKKEVTSDIP